MDTVGDKEYTLEELIALGVYKMSGVDSEGNTLYDFDPEKAKIVAPEVYHAELTAVQQGILDAIDEGYLSIDEIDPDTLEVYFSVNDKE